MGCGLGGSLEVCRPRLHAQRAACSCSERVGWVEWGGRQGMGKRIRADHAHTIPVAMHHSFLTQIPLVARFWLGQRACRCRAEHGCVHEPLLTIHMLSLTSYKSILTSFLLLNCVLNMTAGAMLSVVASMTPYSDYNQSPRNMYQCQVRRGPLINMQGQGVTVARLGFHCCWLRVSLSQG